MKINNFDKGREYNEMSADEHLICNIRDVLPILIENARHETPGTHYAKPGDVYLREYADLPEAATCWRLLIVIGECIGMHGYNSILIDYSPSIPAGFFIMENYAITKTLPTSFYVGRMFDIFAKIYAAWGDMHYRDIYGA